MVLCRDSPPQGFRKELPFLWVVIHYQPPQYNRKTSRLVLPGPGSLSSASLPCAPASLRPTIPANCQASLAGRNSQHPHRQSIWVAPGDRQAPTLPRWSYEPGLSGLGLAALSPPPTNGDERQEEKGLCPARPRLWRLAAGLQGGQGGHELTRLHHPSRRPRTPAILTKGQEPDWAS